MEDLQSLRVVDLKEALKKRELPVSGKKAELIERLKDALAKDAEVAADKGNDQDAKQGTRAQPTAQTSFPAKVNFGLSEEHVKASIERDQVRNDEEPSTAGSGIELAGRKIAGGSTDSQSGREAPDVHVEVGAGEESSPQQQPLDISEAPKLEKAIEASQDVQVEEEAKSPVDQPDPETSLPGAVEEAKGSGQSLAPMQAALLAQQLSADAQAEAGDGEEEIAVDFEADDAEELTPAVGPAEVAQPELVKERARPADAPAERLTAKKQRLGAGASKASPDPSTAMSKGKREPIPMFKSKDSHRSRSDKDLLNQQAEGQPSPAEGSVFSRLGSMGTEGVVKGPGAPPSRVTPTSALLVTGFVRPFRLPDAKSLFQQHGEVKQFWMSAVRDKAYVIFDSPDAAEGARQAVHSLEWPERMRTSLRPKFISVEEAEAVIASNGSTLPVRTSGQGLSLARTSSPASTPTAASNQERNGKRRENNQEPPQKSLEDLFRRTKYDPPLYWLPLTEEQIAEKQKKLEA